MSRTASHAIVDVLDAACVSHIFGVPGTTELPFLSALAEKSRAVYVTCVLDGVAVGIADGYARASGTVGIVNLHSAQGTLNAAGYIRAAYRDNSALVVIAGAPSLSYSIFEPNHFVRGLVEMMRPVTKWGWYVSHADEAPLAVARALSVASAPPKGPTLVVIPQDVLSAPCGVARPTVYLHPPLAVSAETSLLDRAVKMLVDAESPLIIAGNALGRSGASTRLEDLADLLQAPVVSEALDRGPQIHAVNFPGEHPLSLGYFDTHNALIRDSLGRCDVLLELGCKATYPRVIGSLPSGCRVIQVDENPMEIGKNHAVDLGLVGHLPVILAELTQRVASAGARHPASSAKIREAITARNQRTRATLADVKMVGSPIQGRQLARALVDCSDERTVYVDDSQAFGGYFKRYVMLSRPGSLYGSMASHLGWALPAAVGVQLVRPDARVMCLVSDGSFLLSVQALSALAQCGIPLVTVVVDNRSFVSLKLEIGRYGSLSADRLGHLDLSPELDYCAIARGFGVHATRVTDAGQLVSVLREAREANSPSVVDVVMSDHPDDWTEGWYVAPPR